MPRKKKANRIANCRQQDTPQQSSFQSEVGELWIDRNLNRTVTGPGGNRGDHTTPAAKLLKLAEIALKKRA